MRTLRAICETIHLGALGLWAGAVVMTGVTAALAFPIMKALDPTLPEFRAYQGEHWMIAAGSVMNRAFQVSDWIGLGCGAVAGATLLFVVFVLRSRIARPATVLRIITLAAAIGVSIQAVAALRPRMQSELTAYWDAARAGHNDDAALHKQAFEEMHPKASFLLGAQLVTVLLAIGAGGLAAFTDPGRSSAVGSQDPTNSGGA